MTLTSAVVTERAPYAACNVVIVTCARRKATAAECAAVINLTAYLSISGRNGVYVLRQCERGCAAVTIITCPKHISGVKHSTLRVLHGIVTFKNYVVSIELGILLLLIDATYCCNILR